MEGDILESPWLSFRLSVRGHNFVRSFSPSFARTALKFTHNVCVHMKLCMCNFHDHTTIGCGIIFPWTCKFYWIIVVQRKKSYNIACTALKVTHNVTGSIELCMCNFHYHTVIDCWIISPWTCKFYWNIVARRNNPTVLHVLNSKLHTMLLVV